MPFPLNNLHTNHIEKIINKLNMKSFFRIQQTCKDMNDFVRNNRNVKINTDLFADLHLDTNGKLSFYLLSARQLVDGLYGIRIEALRIPRNIVNFDQLCHALQEHHITTALIQMKEPKYIPNLANEQYARLLKILKPVHALLKSNGSTRFESLLQVKELKSAEMFIDSDCAAGAMEKFLPRCDRVVITTSGSQAEILELLINGLRVLRSLFSGLLENHSYHRFEFHGGWKGPIPSLGELLAEFRDFRPTVIADRRNLCLKCNLGSDGSYCELKFDESSAQIDFHPELYNMIRLRDSQ